MQKFNMNQLSSSQTEQLIVQNLNLAQVSIPHSQKYEKTKRLYNNVIEV